VDFFFMSDCGVNGGKTEALLLHKAPRARQHFFDPLSVAQCPEEERDLSPESAKEGRHYSFGTLINDHKRLEQEITSLACNNLVSASRHSEMGELLGAIPSQECPLL
jgi:hypothetical protein